MTRMTLLGCFLSTRYANNLWGRRRAPAFLSITRPLTPQSDRSDKLVLASTGTGGLDEFTSKLDPAKVNFGFIRVKYANDEHSFREKFAFVIWIGENVKIMRRAKVSRTECGCDG